jgi:hypothetical protein
VLPNAAAPSATQALNRRQSVRDDVAMRDALRKCIDASCHGCTLFGREADDELIDECGNDDFGRVE